MEEARVGGREPAPVDGPRRTIERQAKSSEKPKTRLEQVAGARQGGLDRRQISHAAQAAMCRELAVVDGEHQVKADPAPRHYFARARRISLSSCMIYSANCIWRSKSGS